MDATQVQVCTKCTGTLDGRFYMGGQPVCSACFRRASEADYRMCMGTDEFPDEWA